MADIVSIDTAKSKQCETVCQPTGCKSTRIPVGKMWFKVEVIHKDDTTEEIDFVDLRPMPYEADGGVYVFYKDGKEYEVKNYKSVSLIRMALCTDPACTDPECLAYQEKVRKHR